MMDVRDVDSYKKWFSIGYRERNVKVKFLKSVVILDPPMLLGKTVVDTKMWCYELQSVGKRLSDTHIDAMFYYFRIFTTVNVGKPTRATSTDCFFDAHCKVTHKTALKYGQLIQREHQPTMSTYPAGHLIPFSRSWNSVDFVYIPIFMKEHKHWILVVLNTKRWQLEVYNSNRENIDDDLVLNYVTYIRTVIPMISYNGGVLPRNVPKSVMPCVLMTDAPQQENSVDYGIFLLKYAV